MKKNLCLALMAGLLALASCSDDKELSVIQRTKASFSEKIGGEFSTMQWWHTAVELTVSVKTLTPVSISAYSLQEEGATLYDYKLVTQDSTFALTVPQTANRSVVLVAKDGTRFLEKDVYLTGSPQQAVTIDMGELTSQDAILPPMEQAPETRVGASLYGTDIQRNIGYTEVERTGIETVLQYVEEAMDINARGLDGNYELISRGPFNITLYYGFTGCYGRRILGYYRHSPGTYQDLEFVDLVDTHFYDYINGEAKLQYQLDGKSPWYDSNFDYRDGYTAPFTSKTDRLNDDVYNIQHVINRYGDRMTKARGLTWEIDVPIGDRIGFYLRMEGQKNDTQRERMIKIGLPSKKLPSPLYETNWSAKAMNTDGKHRSVLIQDNGYTIMGMEDGGTNSDYDCNDVLFGLHARMESEMPVITKPDIDAIIPSAEPQLWTIAYEDVWREADFDFNDAVILLEPDYVKETCSITLMAAGSTAKMYLHYDGPDGDQNLGEIHELFGNSTTSKINTPSATAIHPFVRLGNVKWRKEYNMTQDARRFYIEVQRGTCVGCSDQLTLPYQPGAMPQAILVAGSWHWPKEGIDICSAYKSFAPWAMDMTNTTFWNWHTQPQSDQTVNYESW